LLFSDTYLTIQAPQQTIFKDKGSKFLAFAFPVENDTQIKAILFRLKKEHPTANHHCYAYILGADKQNFRANDDGEPNGTAGKPILGQIDSNKLTNCLIVVVRYFGGTKLGVSGLIDAYKECAKQTISETTIIEESILYYYNLQCSYETINKVYQIIHLVQASIIEQFLDNQSTFMIALDQDKASTLESKLIDDRIAFTFIERK